MKMTNKAATVPEKPRCIACDAIKEACEKTKDGLLCEVSMLIESGAPVEKVVEKLKVLPRDSLINLLESLDNLIKEARSRPPKE